MPPLPPMVLKNNKVNMQSSRNEKVPEYSQTFIETSEEDCMQQQDGILIMSLKELFQKVSGVNGGETIGQRVYIIRCSYFEIYNDAIYDLLNSQKELAFNEPLQLQEDIRVSLNMSLIFSLEERIHRQGTQRVRS